VRGAGSLLLVMCVVLAMAVLSASFAVFLVRCVGAMNGAYLGWGERGRGACCRAMLNMLWSPLVHWCQQHLWTPPPLLTNACRHAGRVLYSDCAAQGAGQRQQVGATHRGGARLCPVGRKPAL
jgi:hypothetical protein